VTRKARIASLLLVAAVLAAACSSSRAPRDKAALGGTITYRERIALPADARVEIQLLDATRGDAPSSLVAEQLLDAPGQVPIAFSLPYDPRSIDASRTYALRVRIRVGEELWFASPFDLRVLTKDNPSRVEVLLDRVSAGGPVSAGRSDALSDPDPPNLDPRVKALRTDARAIDARLDRLDMREVVDGGERLRLWLEEDAPVKLQAVDTSRVARVANYYFRGGELFWVRVPDAGYAFEAGALVLRTDARLAPVAAAEGSGSGVLRELESRLALFGLGTE
jgi:putative lipoprotein